MHNIVKVPSAICSIEVSQVPLGRRSTVELDAAARPRIEKASGGGAARPKVWRGKEGRENCLWNGKREEEKKKKRAKAFVLVRGYLK